MVSARSGSFLSCIYAPSSISVLIQAQALLFAAATVATVATVARGDDDGSRSRSRSHEPTSRDMASVPVHNPHNATVTVVHMVQSAHFDAGCKTPRCSLFRLPGEPDRCARVGAGNAHGATDPTGQGEPWNLHIINRYFDEYLLKAVRLANESRGTSYPYRHMTQSLVLSLFFDCENAGMLSWPGSGWEAPGTPVLHCPNETTIQEVRAALQRGDIHMHAFPHDGEASYYPDPSMFDAALGVAAALSADLGIPPPRSVSQRDVPGWTVSCRCARFMCLF